MKEKLFAPGEIIYNKGDFNNRVYFIIKGEIEFNLQIDEKEQKIYKKLSK